MKVIRVLKNGINLISKISFVVSVFTLVLFLFFFTINLSQKNNPAPSPKIEIKSIKEAEKTGDPKNVEIVKAAFCASVGLYCKNPDNAEGALYSLALKPLTTLYSYMPASGIDWSLNVLSNSELIPSVFAQPLTGYGFASIYPLYPLWQRFRDLTYMILVILSLVIGFMILFKVKLNPQTEITIQNALPKIVITLLLITFSFPLVGFLIDMMYVTIGATASILYSPQISETYLDPQFTGFQAGAQQQITQEQIAEAKKNAALEWINKDNLNFLIRYADFGVGFRTYQAFEGVLPTPIRQIFIILTDFLSIIFIRFFLNNTIIRLIKIAVDGFFIEGTSILLSVILERLVPLKYFALALIIVVTAFILFVRIFAILFKNYVTLILQTIFAPIIIVFSAIPGQNTFGQWLKNILGSLLAFPLTVVFVLVAEYISITIAYYQSVWKPPFISGINTTALGYLIGLTLLFSLPNYIALVKKMIGADDSFGGFNVFAIFGGIGAVAGGLGGTGQFFQSLTAMPVIGHRLKESATYKKLFGRDKLADSLEELVAHLRTQYLPQQQAEGVKTKSGGG